MPKKYGVINANQINEIKYPKLSRKDFEVLLFWHAIDANEWTIRQCNHNCGIDNGLQTIIIFFLGKIRAIEKQNSKELENNKKLYQLVETKLSDVLDNKLIECLFILYKAANKNYQLTDITPLSNNKLLKLQRFIRCNSNITGAESRVVRNANISIRNFHRRANLLQQVAVPGYCRDFQSLNELVNDLVVKDNEFTSSKFNEIQSLPTVRPLYDSKPGRWIMTLLEYEARNIECMANEQQKRNNNYVPYAHLIELVDRPPHKKYES